MTRQSWSWSTGNVGVIWIVVIGKPMRHIHQQTASSSTVLFSTGLSFSYRDTIFRYSRKGCVSWVRVAVIVIIVFCLFSR
jgi:hypothetical protein